MASRTKLTDSETLELYRVGLDNAENQSEIASAMGELGYNSETIGQGKLLLEATRRAFNFNATEDDETSASYNQFATLREVIDDQYTRHRKKAKVVFRKDPLIADQLLISGIKPRAYVPWLESVRRFYELASTNTDIQTRLARLGITPEELTATLNQLTQLEAARSLYLLEKGESQEATKAKDAAFAQMDDWMSEFYAVARIALEDQHQLLEALGKTVKS